MNDVPVMAIGTGGASRRDKQLNAEGGSRTMVAQFGVGMRQRTTVLGCEIDVLTTDEAVLTVTRWLSEVSGGDGSNDRACRFVVTPNLDHAVLLEQQLALRDAYRDAALVLADGMPLVWASRLAPIPLPERVTGSDLVPAVLANAEAGTAVFFLGASDEASHQAVVEVRRAHPHLEVVGRLSPPFGFEHSEDWSEKIVAEIRQSRAALVVVGFGAPKQELWVHRHFTQLPGTVILCAGATIDFLGGTVKRAPVWAQRFGLEWAHRLLSDPRRLSRRYGKDAVQLPKLLWRDFRHYRVRKTS